MSEPGADTDRNRVVLFLIAGTAMIVATVGLEWFWILHLEDRGRDAAALAMWIFCSLPLQAVVAALPLLWLRAGRCWRAVVATAACCVAFQVVSWWLIFVG